jgi:hypothetical protein
MKNNSDRPTRRHAFETAERIGLEREPAAAREPVTDYFTLYLLQELLSSLGLRHKQ